MYAHRLLLVFVLSAFLLGLLLLFGTAKQANAEPTCDQFWYSDSREVFAMIWEPGDAARSAAEDAIAWFNEMIPEHDPLVVDDQMQILVVFRDRNNGRWLSEENIIFEGDRQGPTLGLIVYDTEAEGMTVVELPYTTLNVEYKIEHKREDGMTSVEYMREVTGLTGDLEVKAQWIELEPSTLPEDGELEHTTPNLYFRSSGIQPHVLRLVTSRRTQYFLFDDGIPTENLNGELRFSANLENTDYQAIFDDPGNVLVRASAYTGEDILYTCE
jgi:hypothetical protein